MEVNYTGIDWLTCTTKNDAVGQGWYQLFCTYRDQQDTKNVFEHSFSNGYYSGLKVASMKWGYSERLGYILVVSGGEAMEYFRYLHPVSHKVTRLDLAVDMLYREPVRLAGDAYEEIVKEKLNGNRKYTHFQNTEGGETLYVGSRQSMQFGRLYDKGAQSGTAPIGNLWRFEVEFKKPMSGEIATHLATFEQQQLTQEVVNRVGDWFTTRHVDAAMAMLTGTVQPIYIEKRVTTADKKLAWLAGQVAPTVSRLVEAGLGREVLRCLLLDERQVRKILEEEA